MLHNAKLNLNDMCLDPFNMFQIVLYFVTVCKILRKFCQVLQNSAEDLSNFFNIPQISIVHTLHMLIQSCGNDTDMVLKSCEILLVCLQILRKKP